MTAAIGRNQLMTCRSPPHTHTHLSLTTTLKVICSQQGAFYFCVHFCSVSTVLISDICVQFAVRSYHAEQLLMDFLLYEMLHSLRLVLVLITSTQLFFTDVHLNIRSLLQEDLVQKIKSHCNQQRSENSTVKIKMVNVMGMFLA